MAGEGGGDRFALDEMDGERDGTRLGDRDAPVVQGSEEVVGGRLVAVDRLDQRIELVVAEHVRQHDETITIELFDLLARQPSERPGAVGPREVAVPRVQLELVAGHPPNVRPTPVRSRIRVRRVSGNCTQT